MIGNFIFQNKYTSLYMMGCCIGFNYSVSKNRISMSQDSASNKNNNTGKLFFILSICGMIYWFFGQVFDVYHFALVGAGYELVWLPMLAILFVLPVWAFVFWVKERLMIRSFFLYSICICITTILLMLIKK